MQKKKKWLINDSGEETIIEALTMWGALGIHYTGDRFGLHNEWQFTTTKTGWILASDGGERKFCRKKIKLKEVE
tara:strand:- start:227 stop:448 length:222 start_codon:yes stop_codon:yes gene_type:complete